MKVKDILSEKYFEKPAGELIKDLRAHSVEFSKQAFAEC